MHQDDENPADELTQLQLRVARRADELARENKVVTPMNLHCWLMAEFEHIDQGLVSKGLAGLGSISRKMVQQRASQLARTSGRQAHEVRQGDYEQAKRELTGERDVERQNAILDAQPSSKGWFSGGEPAGQFAQPA
jgi:hypothetical protein